MTYALYYAGMANDMVTEQIGLALSPDGRRFQRVGDGLLVPAKASHPWKGLRTCNPTVIAVPGGFRMYYQGISAERDICIAGGFSGDGLAWDFDDEPCLTVPMLAEALEAPERRITDVIEPAVLVDGDGLRMWFVTRGANEPGNRLHHARSADGRTWRLDGVGLVAGTLFGPGRQIHYPQIVPRGSGFDVYLSVRAKGGYFTVVRGQSADGLAIDGWREVIPRRFRRGFLDRLAHRLIHRARPYALGLAHSHVVAGEEAGAVYYHAYHLDARRRIFMDIVRAESPSSSAVEPALSPAVPADAWDAFFVADPFIIRLD